MQILWIRHGQTQGNVERRYVGRTDEGLTADAKEKLKMRKQQGIGFEADLIYVSPMIRCRDTADLLFPEQRKVPWDGLQETDFGDFEYKNYDVNFVSNFTDVDDKIIKKANEEGVTAEEISKRYIEECKKDMEGMNIQPATKNPLATEEIGGMISMIETLIEKGYAYEKNGTVYYRTRKFAEYGKLSHKNLDDLQSGFRSLQVSGEDQKEDPLDFVLWKPKKEGEPSWPSPWCDGRPGWHIECSVMAKKYLGDEIDIHAGGEDLIFPHHENEIAQSECCNDKIFAKYWMHNAFLNIDNRKMSKSLGNFRTVREISEQYDLQVLRFFMLNAHYRSPLNFSADLMESSKNALERITEAAGRLKDRKEKASAVELTEAEKKLLAEAEGYKEI